MDILFRKTIEQCRQLGARGGRAHARNLRLRKFQTPRQPVAEIPGPPSETAHQASLRLDAQFPAGCGLHAPTDPQDAVEGSTGPAGGSHLRTDQATHWLGPSAGQPVPEFPGDAELRMISRCWLDTRCY